MKTFRKKIKQKDVYKEYARILNGILGLSDRELELFYLLLEVDDKRKPILNTYQNLLSTDVRRAIMNETMVNKSNLIKYINSLVSKQILIKSDKGYMLNNIFKPFYSGEDLVVQFDLIVDKNEENR